MTTDIKKYLGGSRYIANEPSYEELASAMEIDMARLTEIMSYYNDSVSLDTPIGDDEDATLGDICPDDKFISSEERAEKIALSDTVAELLDTLPEKDLQVLIGDIVKPCCRRWAEKFGILRIAPEREKQRKELLSNGLSPDDEEYVEFFEEGNFYHTHLLPTELELVKPGKITEEIKAILQQAPGQLHRDKVGS